MGKVKKNTSIKTSNTMLEQKTNEDFNKKNPTKKEVKKKVESESAEDVNMSDKAKNAIENNLANDIEVEETHVGKFDVNVIETQHQLNTKHVIKKTK